MSDLRTEPKRQPRLAGLLAGSVLMLSAGLGQAADFVCSAMLADGQMGLIFVQTDKRERAEEIARQSKPRDEKGVRQAVVLINQCIVKNEERFRDPKANEMLESMPM
ncbi:exported protein of unknown function [Thauera humireducens]|uniref:hypothetical protein n=1 Tax=Thauera humireducens TaxID=1134435 RepID=UPI002467A2B2|nr:hypothetical protein [Thauera humireducens]CAH1748577.1 exported protein of unknown function [Thauera humireducens]